ncbi:MAG: hypothetical protein HY823_05275 [Acidobacteria bacterium]|nr:hypothetical protein [Acidobacteriota bacterium]
MKKFLALALVSSFAFVAFAEDKKAEAPKKPEACKMECCKKNKADCKTCPDCKKAAAAKADAKKS